MSQRRRHQTLSFDDLRGKPTRSYIRESTVGQAGPDHYGPDLQREGIRKFCERVGLEQPEREYFDTSSGTTTEGRGRLQAALADADDYDVLVFFHSSRSFRNRADAVAWKQ